MEINDILRWVPFLFPFLNFQGLCYTEFSRYMLQREVQEWGNLYVSSKSLWSLLQSLIPKRGQSIFFSISLCMDRGNCVLQILCIVPIITTPQFLHWTTILFIEIKNFSISSVPFYFPFFRSVFHLNPPPPPPNLPRSNSRLVLFMYSIEPLIRKLVQWTTRERESKRDES